MAVLLNNIVRATLAASVTSTATTVILTAGQGARFPAPSGGDWFPLALEDANANIEICRATARNGDSITVQRAQEGTMARAFEAGSACELRMTVNALLTFIQQNLPQVEEGWPVIDVSQLLQRSNNLSDVPNKATARLNLGVYSATQVDDLIADVATGGQIDLTVYAKKSENLADLPDKGTARTNLDVYSKGEVNNLINTGGGGSTTPTHPVVPATLNSIGAYVTIGWAHGQMIPDGTDLAPRPQYGMTVEGANFGLPGTWRVQGWWFSGWDDELRPTYTYLIVRLA